VAFTSEKAGTYNITVNVSDSGPGSYQTTSASWDLTVTKAATKVTNVSGSGTAGQSDGQLKATLSSMKSDNNTFNKNLAGKSVKFKIDSTYIPGFATTDSNGVAILKDVDLSSFSAGTHTMSAAFTGDDGYSGSSGSGSMAVEPPPDSTPPDISAIVDGTPGTNGWYTSNVTVIWTVNDGQSTVTSPACGSTTISSDTAGQTVTCSATSAGGTNSQSVSIKRDATKPVISRDAVKSGTLGLNGWYTTDVGYGFTASDGLSGLADADKAFTKNITTEGSAQKVSSGTVRDRAGNEAVAIDSPDFKIDKSEPVISRDAVKSGTLGLNGWYKSNVEYGFTALDPNGANGSGLALADQAFSKLIQTEGSAQNVASGTVKDLAGNVSASINSPDFKIDKTAPINVSGSPDRTADSNGWYNRAVGFTFAGSDATSGIASCSTPTYNGPDGTGLTVNGSCTDVAGNQSASVASSAIDYDATAPVNVSGTLARAADHNGWYNAAVNYSFSGNDATSGIAANGCSSGIYSGPDGTGLTVGGSCTDRAGNSANGSTPVFKFDDTNPALAPVVSPNPVQLNGSATVDAKATDATSGVDLASVSCGSVAASSVGAKSVSCSAADNAGNTNSTSANYSVVYGGGFGGILQPINGGLTTSLTTTQGDAAFSDDNSRVKLGSTVPLKFTLTDAKQTPVTDAIARLHVRKLDSTPDAGVDETLPLVTATTGNLFRLSDATTGQYIFNLSTKNVHTNPNGTTVTFTQGTYNAAVMLEDGTLRSFNFNIVK
jgi:hypothetical protein